jgi:hypothetical protein
MTYGRTTAREAPLKYAATFCVEADSQEALEAAVEYVMRRFKGGLVGYACGPQACICGVEVEWGGGWFTVRTCAEHAAYAVAKLLVRAYKWFGGKAMQVVKHEEYTL